MHSILLEKEGLGGPVDLEGLELPHIQMFGSGFAEKDAAEWKQVCLANFVCPLLKAACLCCSGITFAYLKRSSSNVFC